MTHDELVRFAASKVGVEVEAVKTKRYFDPTYPDGSTIATASFLFEEIISHYAIKGTRKRFDLTSPELFLKGMEVCQYYVVIIKDEPVHGYSVRIGNRERVVQRAYTNISEIPETFWVCYAELEGGQG